MSQRCRCFDRDRSFSTESARCRLSKICIKSKSSTSKRNAERVSKRILPYSGVFTLLPLLTGEGRAHHGQILEQAPNLAEAEKLNPLLNDRRFSVGEIGGTHALVESGATGNVVIEL